MKQIYKVDPSGAWTSPGGVKYTVESISGDERAPRGWTSDWDKFCDLMSKQAKVNTLKAEAVASVETVEASADDSATQNG